MWGRITDFLLKRVSQDKIYEMCEGCLRMGRIDLFRELFAEKRRNLDILLVFRGLFTKLLWTKIALAIYLYNRALKYFFERPLTVPDAFAEPFGKNIGRMLQN